MRYLMTVFSLLVLFAMPVTAKLISPERMVQVGNRAPIFSLVDQDGRLISYDQAYYGRHHLVMTFFPAAFTPV